MKRALFSFIMCSLFLLATKAFPQESVTITTYYPSPNGVYQELRANRMAVGDNYSDNSQFCWTGACTNAIDANADLVVEGRVGFGTVSPVSNLNVVNTDGAAYPRGVVVDQYSSDGSAGHLNFRKARGTVGSPTAILSGDNIGRILFTAHNGTAFSSDSAGATIRAFADENWTATANGTVLQFMTTGNGSAAGSERMRIASNGNVGIGTTSPQAILDVSSGDSGLVIPRTTASSVTSPVTGMIIYDTGTNALKVYTNTGWKAVGGGGSYGGCYSSVAGIMYFNNNPFTGGQSCPAGYTGQQIVAYPLSASYPITCCYK